MRKILALTFFVAVTAVAAGCSRNPCAEPWRPGYYLFGAGRQQQHYQQYGNPCCDPCAGGPAMMAPVSAGVITPAPGMSPVPCCQ